MSRSSKKCPLFQPIDKPYFIQREALTRFGDKRVWRSQSFLSYKAFSFSSNTQISKKFVKSGF